MDKIIIKQKTMKSFFVLYQALKILLKDSVMYLNDSGIRNTSRVLKISTTTVMNYIKNKNI